MVPPSWRGRTLPWIVTCKTCSLLPQSCISEGAKTHWTRPKRHNIRPFILVYGCKRKRSLSITGPCKTLLEQYTIQGCNCAVKLNCHLASSIITRCQGTHYIATIATKRYQPRNTGPFRTLARKSPLNRTASLVSARNCATASCATCQKMCMHGCRFVVAEVHVCRVFTKLGR
jgi:hypothetical protein